MYNAAIIGAGPAGYSAAIRLAQLGKSVLLIERDLIGGICINWGCTPSKAMISSAKAARHARMAKTYGVETGPVTIDFDRVVRRRDAVIEHAREGVRQLLDHWGVELVQGEAEVLDPKTVRVGKKGYQAENIIYATGSAPIIPPFITPGDPCVIGSNELVTIKELPETLTVIGGGDHRLRSRHDLCPTGDQGPHRGTLLRLPDVSGYRRRGGHHEGIGEARSRTAHQP